MSIEHHGSEQRRPRWLVPVLVATSILIVMALAAFFLYGRELFQRPFLAIAVVIAWLGALVGIGIGGDSGTLRAGGKTAAETKGDRQIRRPSLRAVAIAIATLVVILGGAVFLYGNDVIEHPLLAVFICLAWLGALAGISIGSDPGRA